MLRKDMSPKVAVIEQMVSDKLFFGLIFRDYLY